VLDAAPILVDRYFLDFPVIASITIL
jgi:hypothetical protein